METLKEHSRFSHLGRRLANWFLHFRTDESNEKKFAIKVDTIQDIAHIEESNIMTSDSDQESSEFLELDGVLDLNGVLINVIKTVKLPS